MLTTIRKQLHETAEAKHVTILFACESGSRAWGFHSPDSDYDVRFAYTHPADWYLTIEDKKDFIELPVNEVFDINGYDIRKLLKLFRGSNAKIYEWIQSPIFYEQHDAFLQHLRSLVPDYFSPKVGLHHYLGLCRNTLETHLQGEQVRLKKYFYALRPVLAARWIQQHGTPPPVEFSQLRTLITDSAVNEHVAALLEKKALVAEKHLVAPDPLLHHFIQEHMQECEHYAKGLVRKDTDAAPLNDLFRKTIGL
ncbi:nucleotidyltransferase domain-containing protein [Paraflavisolibacter sp. H34]|uniref:nucleotidyltransferase domain-containing protein n=1 Tax=Huijunlia imazamoxiresistens TaxID=3127457 RepID=UPI003016D308